MMHGPRGRPGVVLLLLGLAAVACSSGAAETAGVAAAAAATRRLLGNPCGKGSHVCGVRCVPNDSPKICRRKCVTSPKTCRQAPEDCIPCPGVRNGKAVCSEAGNTCSSSCSSGFELAATSGSKRPGSAVCIKSVVVPPPPPPPSPAPVGPQLSKTFFGLRPNAAATQASKEQQLQQYAQLAAARDSVLSALLGQQPSAGGSSSSSDSSRATLLAAACGGSATTPCDGALDALTMALLPAAYSSSSSADTGTEGGFISPAQNQLTCAADVAFAATAAAEAALATALQQSHTSVVGLSEHDCAFCRMTPKVSCSSGSSYTDLMVSLNAGQLQQWASRADAPFLGSVCGRPSAVPATATQLLGCFRDPQLPDGSCGGPQQKPLMLLQVAPGSMTVDACATLARRRGFQYIALANGRDCFGGNSIRAYVVAGIVGTCDVPCEGSAQQVCGSSLSGCAAAVYSVTSGGSFSAAEGGAPLQTVAKIKRSILLNGGVMTSIVPYSDLAAFYTSGAGGVYATSASADNSGSLVQLHALFCFGWSDDEQAWLCKNSLGSSWGLPGGTLKVAYGAAFIMQGSYSFAISFNPDNQGLAALQRLRRQSVPDPQQAGCFLYGGAGGAPIRLLQLAAQLEQAWAYLARSGLATSQPDSQTILEDLLISAAGAPDAAAGGASSASGLAQALTRLSTSAPLRICGASAGLLEPPSSQLDALLQLKADVDHTNTVLTAWTRAAGGDGGFCSWPGVTCDNASQHVTGISLAHVSLGGVMPAAVVLHGLPFLSSLDLSNCSLGGALPQPLTGLPLQSIQLQNNNISSGLPAEWSGLSATLRAVDLSGNAITGGLPEDWHSLDSLVTLRLAHNRISGPAPSWALCENLREVDLSFNELSGALPARLPCRLEVLNLAGNQLSGQLPPVISSLTNLKALNLGRNRFDAQPLPPGDGWSAIESLSFDNNQFTQIPDSYGQLSTLLELRLQGNKISALPASLGSSNMSIQTLLAHENKIVGQLPSALNAMAGTLTRVTLYKNRDLRGCLPMDWQGKVNQPGSGYSLADLTTGTGIPPDKPYCVPAPPPPPPRLTPPDTVTNPNNPSGGGGGSGSSGGSSSGGGGAVMPGGSSGSGGCDPGAGGAGGGGGGGDGGGGGGWGGGDYGR